MALALFASILEGGVAHPVAILYSSRHVVYHRTAEDAVAYAIGAGLAWHLGLME